MTDPEVVDLLVKIFRLYDIVFMMEIRDISSTAVDELLDKINYYQRDENKMKYIISDRWGPTSSKEEYAFFYKHNVVKLVDVIQYDDPQYEQFVRPPFGAIFEASGNQFFVYGIHDQPGNATLEIAEFGLTYLSLIRNEQIDPKIREVIKDSALLMGDLNAGCAYVSQKNLDILRQQYSELGFTWIIPDDVTTMVKTNCPYDRFIVRSDKVSKYTDVGPFYYDKEWGIPQDLASRVSDHYPIHLVINM